MKKLIVTGLSIMAILALTFCYADAGTALAFTRTGTCIRTTTCTDMNTNTLIGSTTASYGSFGPLVLNHTYRVTDGCRVFTWKYILGTYVCFTWDCRAGCTE